MAKYVINIEPIPEKITVTDVEAWIATIPNFPTYDFGGSLRANGYSYRDVDLNIYPPQKDPCPCLELVKNLPSAKWKIDIFCKTCGAYIIYSVEQDTWFYSWNVRLSAFIKGWDPAMRGITADYVKSLETRIEQLEAKSL